jgi:hypothetical protein
MYTVFQVCSAESSEGGLLFENMCISALIIVFGATITLGALLFYLERFYFSCIAPFHSCIALFSNSLCESALVYFL